MVYLEWRVFRPQSSCQEFCFIYSLCCGYSSIRLFPYMMVGNICVLWMNFQPCLSRWGSLLSPRREFFIFHIEMFRVFFFYCLSFPFIYLVFYGSFLCHTQFRSMLVPLEQRR